MTGGQMPSPAPENAQPTIGQKVAAEMMGTFVLVFFGVAGALMSGGDYVVTGLSFGLAMLVMAAAFGRISGGHLNPAVTLGAALGGRLAWRQVPAYMGSQLLGGLLAGASLFGLMHGFPGFDSRGNMGQNFFGDQSPGDYAWWAALLLELLLTTIFVLVILAATDARNSGLAALAPIAIGLSLAGIHFASMAATGTSVNPARSIGVGVFAGTDAIIQLWLFIVAPLFGGALAGATYPLLFGQGAASVPGSGLHFSPRPRRQTVGGYGQPAPGAAWAGVAGQPHPGQTHPGQPLPGYPQPQPGQWGAPTPQPGQPGQWGNQDPQWGQAAPTQTRQPYQQPNPSQQPAPYPPQADDQWGAPPAQQQGWGAAPDDEDGRTQIRPGG